jgi:polar amino acid transport system substrate-binding protein
MKKMKMIVWAGFIIAACWAAFQVGSAKSAARPAGLEKESVFARVLKSGTIRCGYSVWPPYFEKDPNTGTLSGINYEQAEKIAQKLDLKIEWSAEIGMGEVVSALNSGKIDMMCASLWPDAPRMKLLTLTQPMFFTPAYVYVRNDGADYGALNRPQIKFAGIEGDLTYSAAKSVFPQAGLLALPQNSDPSQLLSSLMTGKADAVIIDEAFARGFMESNPGKIRPLDAAAPVQIYGESFGLKQGELEFKQMLDTAIQTATNSGEMKSILGHYKNYSYAPKPGF